MSRHADRAAAYVREFHETYGVPVHYDPRTPSVAEERLRADLLGEEFHEYLTAVDNGDLVEIADALGDMVYVIYGTALTYGFDLDAILREIHRSNMSKLGEGGQPIRRDDGKILKGPFYSPPNIAGLLNVALAEAQARQMHAAALDLVENARKALTA